MPDINPALEKYAERLLQKENTSSDTQDCSASRVFIPLCGKTVDMAYLTSMAGEVVGVEGIQSALEEFAIEQPELKVEYKGIENGFGKFVGKKITLLRGDFFELDAEKTNGKFQDTML